MQEGARGVVGARGRDAVGVRHGLCRVRDLALDAQVPRVRGGRAVAAAGQHAAQVGEELLAQGLLP